jgi:hypothetical protein
MVLMKRYPVVCLSPTGSDRLSQALPDTLEQSFLGLPLALIAAGVVLLLVVRAAVIEHTAPAVGAVCRSRSHGDSRVPTELSILHGDNLRLAGVVTYCVRDFRMNQQVWRGGV